MGSDCADTDPAHRRKATAAKTVGSIENPYELKGVFDSIAVSPAAKYFVPMQLPYPSAHPFPLILAPMAGVSEAPFRQICRAMGADVVISEFLSSEAIRRRIRNTLEGAEFEEVERPIGIQIYGANPEAMAEAAGLITEHYGPEFIDINFGCPVKKVVQRNGGSGCLKDLDLVQRIIRAVIGATHLPVTVKTRSGWSDDTRDPVGIALRMQDAGARAFTLHARTRTQMFSGKARWDEIARVVEALDIPVIGNGDLMTAEDVVRMRDHTRCAGAMVGRGAFGNPWLFRDGRALLDGRFAPPAPSAAERFAVALQHARLAIRLQGDTRKTVLEFRKHLGWYTKGLHGATDLRQRLFAIESIAEAESIFLDYLDPVVAVA
jgi:tRNA-dihydrouridine synthase B